MKLIPVVFKKNRLHVSSMLAFHSHKCWGGVLNPNAHYYVRRIVGQNVPDMVKKLNTIVQERQQSISG